MRAPLPKGGAIAGELRYCISVEYTLRQGRAPAAIEVNAAQPESARPVSQVQESSMRNAILLLLGMTLAACATTAGYEKVLNSWIGADEISLVRAWGAPSRSYETAGSKFLGYTTQHDIFLPGTPMTYTTTMVGVTTITTPVAGTPGYAMTSSCLTTFEIVDGKVVRWSHQGSDCKAPEK